SIAQEETLLRREAVDDHTRLALHCFLEGGISDDQTPQVRNGLSHDEVAVFVESLFDFKAAELIDDAFRALFESFEISFTPPVSEISCSTELTTLIVKAVRHLVADNRSHAAIVKRVISG